MEKLLYAVHLISFSISLFSVFILVFGFLLCVKNLIVIPFSKHNRERKLSIVQKSRVELGTYVLLGLEILIIADIIETVVNPNIEELITLGAIVAIRTTISFFLHREVEQVECKISPEENEEK